MTSLQEATRNWSDELAAAGKKIAQSSWRLQAAYATASEQLLLTDLGDDDDEEIPDPIKLVHRIVALELAMKRIQKECQELTEKREEVVIAVMERQQKSVNAIRQLENRIDRYHDSKQQQQQQSTPKSLDSNDEKEQEQTDEWKKLANQLDNQLVLARAMKEHDDDNKKIAASRV